MNAIELQDLTKKYGNKTVVDRLCLHVPEGELLALLGLNGAGKSTTIRMLSCLTSPDSGEATLLGHSIRQEPEKVKQIIGVSPQESATAPNLTVLENLELMAALYGTPKNIIEELEERFSLSTVRNQKSKTLSGGWRRRLSIAMAMAGNPKILFLDEPTLGLDIVARRELWNFIRSLKGKMTVVLTTHYLEEAEALADHVAVLTEGKLRAFGTAQELIAQTGAASFEDAFLCLTGKEALA